MIFEAELRRARERSAALAEQIRARAEARARVGELLTDYTRRAGQLEEGLAQARQVGGAWPVPVYRRYWWQQSGYVDQELLDPADERGVRTARQGWAAVIDRLTATRDRLDRAIRELEERKFRIDFWLLEKGETWGRVDEATLKEQMRDILRSADELSRLIVGRPVGVAFDTTDGSPLGYVPVEKERKGSRKVYLTGAFLAEQPTHLMDYYKALLVHELGHVLLHLKDHGRDYHRLRRLMRDQVTQAPDFFPVFNILLDEQLERILRNTRPEWQGWFNRLDFYVRRVPQRVFRDFLARGGAPDPAAALADLAARGLVKLYDDPKQPFAVVQSAEVFSAAPGFTRLYAFYAVLRHRLPRSTVREAWLAECLDLIPPDFKTLDVFQVHALAVEVYRILTRGQPAVAFVTLRVRRGRGGVTEVLVPGSWSPTLAPAERGRVRDLGGGGGGVTRSRPERPPPPPTDPDPEGGPPPVPPPPLPPPPVPQRPPKPPKPPRVVPVRVSLNPYKGPSVVFPAGPLAGSGGGRGSGKRRGKSKAKPSAKNQLQAKLKAGKLSAKERARLARAARPVKHPPTPPPKAPKAPKPKPPKAAPPPPPPTVPPPPPDDGLDRAEWLAAAALPAGPVGRPGGGLNRALEQIAREVRAEQAKRPAPPVIDRMAPDAVPAADRRNEADDPTFPPPDEVFTLRPDRRANQLLARSVRPLVNVLRPYLSVADPARVPEERLPAGRRLLSGALAKHLAYGETRLFADHRQAPADRHAEVLIAVLIDTSASMGAGGRLDRAQRLAVLLAECLRECDDIDAAFLGYNQSVYRCGDHEGHSVGSLAAAGTTNEAAALDHLTPLLAGPRRRKAVVVFSDGLPTACSVEAVRRVVRRLERELGARCLHAALGGPEHPAYARRADISGELTPAAVRNFGRAVAGLL